MFTISSAMDLSQVTLIESCTSSKEMIEKLDSIFKLKSDFNKMLLLDKFYQLKMECNETVVQYISKVENLAHHVKDAGETISDATVITKILGTLPPKYKNLRQAWLSVDDSKQNLSNLTTRLIDEETSLSQSEQTESAFFVYKFEHPDGDFLLFPSKSVTKLMIFVRGMRYTQFLLRVSTII
ncbi:hypothetical protein AVEN_97232-1 [Araneus ventricosus]|uniref:Retrotransposon gag domain-containing protein n=1 Tax=Araneus ventricosus TaxID=182803 RepID=A0A4Y2V884_ARAVE|nr:hypothetical protein AVEN_97232-1 [Araneus ventricosus]